MKNQTTAVYAIAREEKHWYGLIFTEQRMVVAYYLLKRWLHKDQAPK